MLSKRNGLNQIIDGSFERGSSSGGAMGYCRRRSATVRMMMAT